MNFPTLADDAKPFALALANEFGSRGFTVTERFTNKKLSRSPTFVAKRLQDLVICEIVLNIDLAGLYAYRSFAKNRLTDTRVQVYLLPRGRATENEKTSLKKWGFGLFQFSEDRSFLEVLNSLDQSLDPDLPPLSEFPRKLRSRFGPAYDHFNASQWIPGFELACSVFEQLARAYLWEAVNSGRVLFASSKGPPTSLPKKKIDKLTMGALGIQFGLIISKTAADSAIGDAINAVNPARVEAAHRKGTAKADKMIRRNIEQNIWTILGAVKQLA